MRASVRRYACSFGVAAAVAFAGISSSYAQSTPEKTAAAQALYDEGMSAMNAKDFAKACPKFDEASRLVPEGIGVKIMLGECYEGAGKLASAWAIYRVVESEAARAKQEERRSKAQKRISALEPKLARVTVELAQDAVNAPGLKVSRGSVEVGASVIGSAVPVDAGEIAIVASSSRGDFQKRITIHDGESVTVRITFQKERPSGPPSILTAPGGGAGSRKPDESSEGGLGGMGIGGIVLGSVGLALAGAGIGLGVKAIADESDANDICPDERCASREAVDLSDRAHTFSIVSWVGIGVGVAAMGAGVALLVVSLQDGAPGKSTADVLLSPAGIGYRARF